MRWTNIAIDDLKKYNSYNCNQVVRTGYAVRRLTPLECERLQGFPAGWTDIGDWKDDKGKLHKVSDANRYKALGNSIAIPSWFYVLQRLSVCCIDTTMASLFGRYRRIPVDMGNASRKRQLSMGE